jgi:hypothetical protein
MDNLYLITRLDDIRTAFIALVVLAGIAFVCFIILYFTQKAIILEHSNYSCNVEDNKYLCKIGKRYTIISLVVTVISMLSICAIPTTKQGLLIFGINEAVEFCEKHPDTKQLPDKCIKALNKYLDEELQD